MLTIQNNPFLIQFYQISETVKVSFWNSVETVSLYVLMSKYLFWVADVVLCAI